MDIPAYAVFANKELSVIATIPSITLASLKTINGIGKGRIDKVGESFVKFYNEKS